MKPSISIRRLGGHIGESVTLKGWVAGKRSSGKIHFVQFRDGTGIVQAVASRSDVSEQAWAELERATQESTVTVTGVVREEKRAPSGVELGLTDFHVDHLTLDFGRDARGQVARDDAAEESPRPTASHRTTAPLAGRTHPRRGTAASERA